MKKCVVYSCVRENSEKIQNRRYVRIMRDKQGWERLNADVEDEQNVMWRKNEKKKQRIKNHAEYEEHKENRKRETIERNYKI